MALLSSAGRLLPPGCLWTPTARAYTARFGKQEHSAAAGREGGRDRLEVTFDLGYFLFFCRRQGDLELPGGLAAIVSVEAEAGGGEEYRSS